MEQLIKTIRESNYNEANSIVYDMLYQKLNDKFEQRLQEVREASDNDGDEYKKFFQSALKKFGVSSPGELEGDKKKKFYDYVDKNWKSDREKETGKEDPKESVELGEADPKDMAAYRKRKKEIEEKHDCEEIHPDMSHAEWKKTQKEGIETDIAKEKEKQAASQDKVRDLGKKLSRQKQRDRAEA